MKTKLFAISFLLCTISLKAQLTELGLHAGYNISKLKVDQMQLNDEVFIRPGRLGYGLTFGAQLLVGPPKKQSSPKLRIIPAALFEASLCRCRNNMELSITNANGTRSFSELQYLIYRADLSGKFVGTVKKFHFMIGPTITTKIYAGVKVGASEGLKYAGDQFKTVVAGYELGVGKRLKSVVLSMRYQGLLERYGQESVLIPTEFKNYQFRFILAYYFLKHERGSNWKSIYWK